MNMAFETVLDKCLSRLDQGENLESCLSRYPDFQEDLRRLLETATSLHDIPVQHTSAARYQQGRNRMLAAVSEEFSNQAVSRNGFLRYAQRIFQPITRKEPFKMTSLATLLLIVSTLLSGTGVTVYAAQGSLPNQTLYPVKLISEDVRTNLATSAQSRLNLSLDFADQRVQELNRMISAGQTPPPAVLLHWQQELDFALQQAARLNDAQMAQMLTQIQTRLLEQQQALTTMLAATPTDPELLQAQTLLKTYLQGVALGLQDPAAFRQMFGATAPLGSGTAYPGSTVPAMTATPFPGAYPAPSQSPTHSTSVHPTQYPHDAWMTPGAVQGTSYPHDPWMGTTTQYPHDPWMGSPTQHPQDPWMGGSTQYPHNGGSGGMGSGWSGSGMGSGWNGGGMHH